MKYIDKFSARIIAAVLVGFLLAGAFTKITYTCMPTGGALGCISFDKAVMHLGDLMSNKQSSLMYFSATFLISSLIIFIILSLFGEARARKAR